jgi:hypothetical protein
MNERMCSISLPTITGNLRFDKFHQVEMALFQSIVNIQMNFKHTTQG